MPHFPRITRVNYLAADSAHARMLYLTVADTWSGSDIPDWRENEYIRGQVETLGNSIRFITEAELEDDVEFEDIKDRIWAVCQAALVDLYKPRDAGTPSIDAKLAEYGLL